MCKTVLINCSPKKSLSVSGFVARCTALLLRGTKCIHQLRTPADHQPILNELCDADKVIFVMPLYVDGVPAHVLPFLKKLEELCLEHSLHLKVYVIANNGFIEGCQNEPLMQVMENFCARSGLSFCGGVGFGGGVMVNVTRIMLMVVFGLTLLNMLLNAIQGENVLPPLLSFAQSAAINLLLCGGIIGFLIRLVVHINRGSDAGKRYTRILIPSFLFIPITDIFFTIISIFNGGIFRGWFSRFSKEDHCDIVE